MPIFCTTRWQIPRWSNQAVFLLVSSRQSRSDWAAPLVGSIDRGAWLQGMLDGLSLIGTEGFVRDRIAAHKAAGVTWLDVTPIGPDPYGDVRRVREWIG